MNQKLAISYVRFSTIGQSDGDSVRRQTEATEAYCKKHGLTLTNSYRLADLGKSAYKGDHRNATGALGQLEKEVKAGKIPKGTVLIVENLDRLSREDIVTAQLLLLNLIHHGIEIVALSDNERRYSKETLANNPMDLIVSIMVLSRAHEESKIKSYRVKESWLNRKKLAAEGKFIKTRLPSWIKADNGRYVTSPDKAEIIKRIFRQYLAGYGIQTIATMLCKEGIPNIAKEQRGRADRWCGTYVRRILTSKEVIGYYTKNNPEVPNFFPAIISEEEFYATQAKIKERYNYKGQRNHTPHPFSHLLKCGLCGESVVKAHSNGYLYLQCHAARVKLCTLKYMPYTGTEKALLKVLAAAGPASYNLDDNSARQLQTEMDAMQGKAQEIDQKLSVASKLFAETPSDAGAKILQQLEAQKRELLNQLEEKRNSTFLIDYRANWKDVKARIDKFMEQPGTLPLEVIPVSVKQTGERLEFLRHEAVTNENDIIALRESFKAYIEKIVITIPQLFAIVHFKNGETLRVDFKIANTYPRRFYYKTPTTDWAEAE